MNLPEPVRNQNIIWKGSKMLFGQRMLKCRYGEYGNETVGQRTVIEPDGDG